MRPILSPSTSFYLLYFNASIGISQQTLPPPALRIICLLFLCNETVWKISAASPLNMQYHISFPWSISYTSSQRISISSLLWLARMIVFPSSFNLSKIFLTSSTHWLSKPFIGSSIKCTPLPQSLVNTDFSGIQKCVLCSFLPSISQKKKHDRSHTLTFFCFFICMCFYPAPEILWSLAFSYAGYGSALCGNAVSCRSYCHFRYNLVSEIQCNGFIRKRIVIRSEPVSSAEKFHLTETCSRTCAYVHHWVRTIGTLGNICFVYELTGICGR